jgi:hypothetical protein
MPLIRLVLGGPVIDGFAGLPSDLGCHRERRHRLYNRPAEPRDLFLTVAWEQPAILI